MVADDHGVAVGGAGGAAGSTHLFKPVVQPLSYSKVPWDFPLSQTFSGFEVLQSLYRLVEGRVAADGAAKLTRLGPAAVHGDIVAAALGIVGDVGHNCFSRHSRYLSLSCFDGCNNVRPVRDTIDQNGVIRQDPCIF